jgi:Bacterial PH domain
MRMPFSASYDRTTKIVSTLVCLGLLAVAFSVHNLTVALLSLLILAISFAYSPRGYLLEGRAVVVKRLAGSVRIDLTATRDARKATGEDLRGCIRLWGSGGLFGYYGLFSTSKLGKSTWYVTDRSNIVVLATDAKTVLLSPDDADGFLAAIRSVVPPAGERPAPAFAEPRRGPATGRIITVGVALAVLGLIAAGMTYAPDPPNYTLTGETLTIHDRFYPVTLQASEVDVGGIRTVDLGRSSGWRPKWRTNGIGLPHYDSGWFEAANGEKMRLYRAGGARVVLLPPSGAGSPVLYQAANPESFIQQVRAAWSHPPNRAAADRTAQRNSNAGK